MLPYAGVTTYYHKREPAVAVLDHAHALRNGFTRSQNVISELSHENIGFYYHHADSCMQALELMCEKHKLVTGKKVRSDNNVLFEHVVWLSEQQYKNLEEQYGKRRVKAAFLKRLKQYAESVKKEFGFEPLGIDLHFDEGHMDNSTGKFIRNIHAHVQFMNYDFTKRRAPLRHLMKKGKDHRGRTHQLNPNFELLQTLVYQQFKGLGFHRGKSKLITGREHLTKEKFVKNKLESIKLSTSSLSKRNSELTQKLQDKELELSKANELILQRKKDYKWLTEQISKLSGLKKEMGKAITQKCRTTLASILRKQVLDSGSKKNRRTPK